ncbi:MAG TPA: type II CAAX endopeptidase family protein [Ideonella sp.]|uniref:CPBP family intramembrane glutamic endopeptidase n=1 Tax=Ideonella sp. TaxID=1929293 RepID=UPI002CBCC71E|nr:type II CAAX endopeptidase family protein [Ideonella sp.]HSI49860.1 type II CAAX endopeptidase family protein [Ideonella sp.]
MAQPKPALRTTSTPAEALLLMACCFGWFIFSSLSIMSQSGSGEAGAQRMSAGFTDAMLINLVVIELGQSLIALSILRVRGYDLASLYPQPTLGGSAQGVLLYVTACMIAFALSGLFTGTLHEQPIALAMAQTHVTLPVVVLMAVVNGAFEEVFLLGFLMRGMRQHGLAIALGLPLLVRALTHVYQGPYGVVSVLAFGLVTGLAYARTGRLYPVVLAHVLGDIVPFAFL